MPVINGYEFFVQWHLTNSCNLRCTHCYQEAAPPGQELSLPEIFAVIEETADMLAAWRESYGVDFSPSFHVTGGEPLLHQHLLAILAEMKRRGFAVYLLSNGTSHHRGLGRHVRRPGRGRGTVSLEGPAEIHASIRGPGELRGGPGRGPQPRGRRRQSNLQHHPEPPQRRLFSRSGPPVPIPGCLRSWVLPGCVPSGRGARSSIRC